MSLLEFPEAGSMISPVRRLGGACEQGSLATIVMLASLGASGRAIPSASPQAIPARDAMFETIAALDGAMFDAFNHCSSPEELRKHAGYFAPDVEFYHDTGGVTWTLKR